jgi:lipoprotein-anchoring transpeptidase ErfK/SrfK
MFSRTVQGRAFLATGALLAFIALIAAPASAQWFWNSDSDSPTASPRRELVPFSRQFPTGEIIVSFGDRRLYYVTEPGQAIRYPIAVPREDSRWEGVTTVSDKKVNPSWTPTEDMVAENPRLPRWVPGGHPMNPLGVRALYLGSSMYRIHGTDAPSTIGTAVSSGCIRMYNEDVLDLYERASVGDVVWITWQFLRPSDRREAAGLSPR